MITPSIGRPQIGAEQQVTHRVVSRQGMWTFLANGAVIDGTKARDPGNSADTTLLLRPGTLMGKVTANSKYANSVIGTTSGALAGTGTSVTLSAAAAAELVRRVGTSGTFKLTGPPTAAGTVRTLTVTYSAVDTTTGVVTITALGVNEVQTVTFNAAATGGTMVLRVPNADGTQEETAPITWNATDATWLAAIQTALDNATGVASGVVVTGAAPDTALTFTFSGTGYAGLPQPLIEVVTYPTTPVSYNVARTAGVDGRFVTASLAQPTDGSETPISLIADGYGVLVGTAAAVDVDWPQVPIGGVIDPAQILPWPADASLRNWILDQLSTTRRGKFTFSNQY